MFSEAGLPTEILQPAYKCGCVLGEAPIWREEDNTLHYVDPLCDPPELHILKLSEDYLSPVGEHQKIVCEDSITVVAFREGKEGYMGAYYQGFAFVSPDGKVEILKELIATSDKGIKRFNDGNCDVKGRFWAGEIDLHGSVKQTGPDADPDYKAIGRLWRYDPDGSVHEMESDILCANGIGWSPDNKTMYFCDSHKSTIYSYDFDAESGAISSRKVFVNRSAEGGGGGTPDGLVVDLDGNVHVAIYGKSCISTYSPSGQLIANTHTTAERTTCPGWAGKDLDVMWITSAKLPPDVDGDDGGSLYTAPTNGIKGVRKYKFAA